MSPPCASSGADPGITALSSRFARVSSQTAASTIPTNPGPSHQRRLAEPPWSDDRLNESGRLLQPPLQTLPALSQNPATTHFSQFREYSHSTRFGRSRFDNIQKMAGENNEPRSLLSSEVYIPVTRWIFRMTYCPCKKEHFSLAFRRNEGLV